MIIAVDGPAASGKGTLARRLAARYNLAYLDTGSLYRAVALEVLQSGSAPSDPQAALGAAERLDLASIDAAAIRGDEIAQGASIVAAMAPVRLAIRDLQRHFAQAPPEGFVGAVLDGRDIGTVICPDADAKIFVDADINVRAKRRYLELKDRKSKNSEAAPPTESEVLADLITRDARDRGRAISPLVPAENALLLDTSNLSIEAAFQAACELVDQATA